MSDISVEHKFNIGLFEKEVKHAKKHKYNYLILAQDSLGLYNWINNNYEVFRKHIAKSSYRLSYFHTMSGKKYLVEWS